MNGILSNTRGTTSGPVHSSSTTLSLSVLLVPPPKYVMNHTGRLLLTRLFVQGWDQTGSNAANLSFPKEFGIASEVGVSPNGLRDEWIVGAVNAVIFLSAGLVYVCFMTRVLLWLTSRKRFLDF